MKCEICGKEIKHGISQHYKGEHNIVYKSKGENMEQPKPEQSNPDNGKYDSAHIDDKTEGIANDAVNALEPIIRVAEKLSGQPREQFMGNVIKNLINGQVKGAFGAMFGTKTKSTRLSKLKDLIETLAWIILIVMIVFWINYGIAKWMGAL